MEAEPKDPMGALMMWIPGVQAAEVAEYWTWIMTALSLTVLAAVYRMIWPRKTPAAAWNGGHLVADVLVAHGVRRIYSLCGGHISPILVGAKAAGMTVVSVRDERSAAFAADAESRLTGIPGVAVVTAGPGVTNTVTAIKNAQLAAWPLVLIGGAAPTLLAGRGALQEIPQLPLLASSVKWSTSVSRVKDIVPMLTEAFAISQAGVPGPVFVEIPLDALFFETHIRKEAAQFAPKGTGLSTRIARAVVNRVIGRKLDLLYQDSDSARNVPVAPLPVHVRSHSRYDMTRVVWTLAHVSRPVFLVGSGAMIGGPAVAARTAAALTKLGAPVYLSGMARGLLGRDGAGIQFRHKRTNAFKRADAIFLVGVPADFRLKYGSIIDGSKAVTVSVNRSKADLYKNIYPMIPVNADPATFLDAFANAWEESMAAPWRTAPYAPPIGDWSDWFGELVDREADRNQQIVALGRELPPARVNVVSLCLALESVMQDDAIMIADGGDFVGTASYCVLPRAPLSWLDAGVFGPLGVGGGFSLAAASVGRPVWLLWGDGASGLSFSELDTFVRFGLPLVAIIGNDAGWGQIRRDQVPWFGDSVGTDLVLTDYAKAAEGFGAVGMTIASHRDLESTLVAARDLAWSKQTVVVINVHLAPSDFRQGSISA